MNEHKVCLDDKDFEILNILGLNLEKDNSVLRLPPDYLMDFALAVDQPASEALFISCGALRTLDVVEKSSGAWTSRWCAPIRLWSGIVYVWLESKAALKAMDDCCEITKP